MNKVKPIPDGFSSLAPYLIVKGAAQAIEFYKKAFGATVRDCNTMPNGQIAHAELIIGDSLLMLADEFPEWKALSPQTIGGTPVTIHHYVENVDEVFNRALSLGATIEKPLQNQFYGDRSGGLLDPFGHAWHLATHIEDPSPEELKRRFDELMKQGAKG